MSGADLDREERIDGLLEQFRHADDRGEQRRIWGLMRDEINARSAEQVARMERERGLA